MNRGMVRQQLYKNFDVERKNARQAEARLSLRLQRLETICLYRVKTLAREQRQLQKDLQRLQQEIIKKRFSSSLGNGTQKPKDGLTSSPQTEKKHIIPEPKIRAMTTIAQEIKPKTQVSSLCGTGLKDAMRSKEHLPCQYHRSSCFLEEILQPQDKESVKPPKSIDSKDSSVSCHDGEASTDTTEHNPVSRPPTQSVMALADETKSKDADSMPDVDAGEQNTPNSMECAGSLKDESTNPTFLELFEKAKNAHYLRHRAQPESERLLSIGEIFGHGESSLPRAGKDCENGLPPEPLPL